MRLPPGKSISTLTRAAKQLTLNRLCSAPALPAGTTRRVVGNHLELNRSTVVSLLQDLRKTPSRAISVFNQLKTDGFVHDVFTYAAIIRILCSWRMHGELESLLSELVENRDEEVFDLLEVLAGDRGGHVVSEASAVLVKLLARVKDLGFRPSLLTLNLLMKRLVDLDKSAATVAVTIYTHLNCFGLVPDGDTYCFALKAFCKTGQLGDARTVFWEMVEKGITPTRFLCWTYIKGLCEHDGPFLAYEELQNIVKCKLSVTEFAFTAVIRGFCNRMLLEEAKEVLVERERRGFVPNVDCYGPVISGLCRDRKLKEAETLHEEMLSKGVKTNRVVVSTILQGLLGQAGMVMNAVNFFEKCKSTGIDLDKLCYNKVMKAFCELRQIEKAAALLAEMKDKRMVPDLVHYTTVIDGYCRECNLDEALRLFEEMMIDGIKPDIAIYNVLASGFSRSGLAAQTKRLLDYMKDHGIEPSDGTYSIVIEGLSSAGKLEDAEALFYEFNDQRPDICNAMVNGYCSAKSIEKAFELFIALCRQRFVLKKSSCLKLLASLEHDNEKYVQMVEELLALEAEYSYGLCSKAVRMLSRAGEMGMARRLYDLLSRRAISVDLVTYTMMMQGYCKVNCLTEAFHLLLDMQDRGVKPDIITCTVLLDGASKMGLERKEMEKVKKAILDEMKKMNLEPDGVLYTVLMHDYCNVKCLTEAFDLLGDMKDKGVKPNVVTYTVLLVGALRMSLEREKVKKAILDEMDRRNVGLDVVFYNVLIQDYCNVNCLTEAFNLLDSMKDRGVKPDLTTYKVLLDGAFRMGLERQDMEKVKKAIFDEMKERNVEPNVVVYTMLMHGYCKAECWREAWDLLRDMKDRGVKPNVVTYTVLLDGALKMGLEREDIEKVRDAIFDEMKEMNVEPNVVLYTVLMHGYCKAKYWREAWDLLRDMKDRGVKPNVVTYTVLLEGALEMGFESEKTDKVKKAILDEMNEMNVEPNVVLYTSLMHHYCKVKCYKDANDLLDDMKDRRVKPDVITYTVLLYGALKMGLERKVMEKVKQGFVDEMKQMKVQPDAGHFTTLIHRHCKAKNVQEAKEIFKEMIDRGVEPDIVAYTDLLCGHFNVGHKDDARVLLDEMSKKQLSRS